MHKASLSDLNILAVKPQHHKTIIPKYRFPLVTKTSNTSLMKYSFLITKSFMMKSLFFKYLLSFILFIVAFSLNAQPYDIIWLDVVGCSIDGNNNLSKTASEEWGNAGAASQQILSANTDGWAEMTVQRTNAHRLFGLSSNNVDAHYNSINFAIFLRIDGILLVYENGVKRGEFGRFTVGDKLRVERTGSTISYKKNNSTLYTSTVSSTTSLIADVALYSAESNIKVISSFTSECDTDADNDGICNNNDCDDNDNSVPAAPGTSCDDGDSNTENDVIQSDGCTCLGQSASDKEEGGIVWTSIVGANASQNNLTKTASEGWGNGGAASQQILSANTDGWIETTVEQTNTHRMFGLSSTNVDAHYNSINFAIFLRVDGAILVFENGIRRGEFGSFNAGDKLRIERMGNTISYKKNNSNLYTSTVSSTTSLIADVALFSAGATISNANYCFGVSSGGVCNPAVGTACDDNNSETTGETIQENCSCGGGTPTQSSNSVFVNDDNSGDGSVRYSGGKVIIGENGTTKNGDYKLYVQGGILTELAKVAIRNSSSWADYVFDENYQLTKIEEVAKFIKENHHLPNVPSAKEVISDGIDVAKMDATLLRQIEELWLHLIELNNENKQLKSRLNQLEKE